MMTFCQNRSVRKVQISIKSKNEKYLYFENNIENTIVLS